MTRSSVFLVLIFPFICVCSHAQELTNDKLLRPPDLASSPPQILNERSDVTALLVRADTLLTSGKTEAAITEYQNALKVNPASFITQNKLGVAYSRVGNYRAAVNSLLQANRIKSDDALNLDYLAFSYYMLRQPEEAARHYRHLLSLTPKSATAYSNLGYAYLALKDYASGKTAFEAALGLEPLHKQAIVGLCFAYDAEATSDIDAMTICTRAVDVDPTSPQANYLLGYAYLFSGRNDEALPWFAKAQGLDPENPLVQIAMGRAHMSIKRYAEAADDFARAAELAPEKTEAYLGLGIAHFRMRHLDKAAEYFERALQIEPDSSTARFNLGVLCLLRQQRECVLEQYNALKISDSSLAEKLFRGLFRDRILDVRKH